MQNLLNDLLDAVITFQRRIYFKNSKLVENTISNFLSKKSSLLIDTK